MARYYYDGARDTVNQRKRIELDWLKKHNYLTGLSRGSLSWNYNEKPVGNINVFVDTYSETPSIRLMYNVRKNKEEEYREIDYSVPLESVPCRYGGKKWFFRCSLHKNGVQCNKRVRILYDTGDYFGCRTCADLSYESCNKTKSLYFDAFYVVAKQWDADDWYIKHVKRKFYRGKPTKKYFKYLKMSNISKKQEGILKEFINRKS